MDLITYPNGRPITRMINAADLLWMPVDTPFGNFTPKLWWVMMTLAHANVRLDESAAQWRSCMVEEPGSDLAVHRFTANEAVFAMRRAADELVTLISVLSERVETGVFPSKPRCDCVGSAVRDEIWAEHEWLLRTLNDLANAHKHSFVDSDTIVVGQLTPCASALHLPHNDLANSARLYVVALDDLASAYSAFLASAMTMFRRLTECLREP